MSVFSDNITSEISRIEKIRYWFRERILEQFKRYNYMHRASSEYWDACSADDDYITEFIHKDLATMWVYKYNSELREAGVYSTCTNVKKKIGVNKFSVVVRFTTDDNSPSVTFPSCDLNYNEVEVKDLKF